MLPWLFKSLFFCVRMCEDVYVRVCMCVCMCVCVCMCINGQRLVKCLVSWMLVNDRGV